MLAALLNLFQELPCRCLGRVTEGSELKIFKEPEEIYFVEKLETLRRTYKKTLGW